YAYVAITDHAHYLRDGRFAAQFEEVEALNERLGPVLILARIGVRISVRVTGSADFPDEDLTNCDWVMASLHSAFDKSPTERVLSAMEHPHVDCIGHPTARQLNRRQGVGVDIDRV